MCFRFRIFRMIHRVHRADFPLTILADDGVLLLLQLALVYLCSSSTFSGVSIKTGGEPAHSHGEVVPVRQADLDIWAVIYCACAGQHHANIVGKKRSADQESDKK